MSIVRINVLEVPEGQRRILVGRAQRGVGDPPVAAPQGAPAAVSDELPPMVFPEIGFDTADLDRSVKPGDDFDAYVNGKWKNATQIPAKYPYYGVVTDLRLGSERAVKQIIDELSARQNPPDSLEQRVADLYKAFMDVDAINRAGMAPAKPYLDRIAAVKTHTDLADLFATIGYPAPFGEGVSIDRGDPNSNIMFVGIGGRRFGFGQGLSRVVRAALPAYRDAILAEIERLAG